MTAFNESGSSPLLKQLDYGTVRLGGKQGAQFQQTTSFLMRLSVDAMLKPYRDRVGLPAPGADIGGWYDNFPSTWFGRGFAPGHCLGQWISALARAHAISGRLDIRNKLSKVVAGYAQTIATRFFQDLRYPVYTLDKLWLGLLEAHALAGIPGALDAFERTTEAALPVIPLKPMAHGEPRPGRDITYTWDEPYTAPENLFLAYQHGLGDRYLEMAKRLLFDEPFFDRLSRGEDALTGRHAYSHVNALCSAIQAYLTLGSKKHLQAAINAFEMIDRTQSFATGGWAPDELFRQPGIGALGDSLTQTHNSFETSCGSYAHFKLTRYLLRITRDSKYADSMERVMYNTVLGALPLQRDGRAFYYSDVAHNASKGFHPDQCPCCAGSLPQVTCDYHLNAYFRDEAGLFVNLYGKSTLHWEQDGAPVRLTQTTRYPLSGLIRLRINTSRPLTFSLRLRIPAWASDGSARVCINGQLLERSLQPGTFATIDRMWRNGDEIKLRLPLAMRLSAVDEQHADTVALLRGPLVLFAVAGAPLTVTRRQLLECRRARDRHDEWWLETASGPVPMRPFTAIDNQTYQTYLKVS
jgi:DUF1680 family protein